MTLTMTVTPSPIGTRPARIGQWLLAHPVWLLAAFAFWLAATQWMRPLFVPDEGRYVGVALAMLQSHDWLVPRLDGLPFFHKPPLFYWVTATSMSLFGVHEWAARLAPFLGAFFTGATLFWFLDTHASRRAAGLSLLLLGTFPLFFDGSQFASMDMLVASLIAITILLLAHVSERMKAGATAPKILILAYATAALGMLTKGMIGFVLPGMVVTFWLLWLRRYTHLYRLISLPGIVVFLLIAAPWFLLMELKFPGFLYYTFIYQQFDRYLDSTFNNPQPFYFYFMVLFGGLLPWIVGILLMRILPGWRQALLPAGKHTIVSLGVIWVAAILMFFSIPTSKLIGYILPTVPGFALLMALLFDQVLARNAQNPVQIHAWYRRIALLALIGGSLGLVSVITFSLIDHKSHKAVTESIRSEIAPDASVVFYNYYFFSVPFYLDRPEPALVTGEWHDPANFKTDGSNTELYTSAQFDPKAAAKILISTDDLATMIAQARAGARPPVWVYANRNDAANAPLLAQVQPRAQDKRVNVYCFGCTPAAAPNP
ncbi:hypothetical protein A9404_01340 [Halothiobacillus diazotrophicus]|uniref:Glycosyltransferase RgtA/B/C/D-like domain-containing protein n=2 Tax=Halothiobacillus diazotrophicus TaxID=1860122 RepID=A0A191ZE95_9GAMM|nr:hypothetical protein A9404_01340 [Halothiobacillus diazotrophicus]